MFLCGNHCRIKRLRVKVIESWLLYVNIAVYLRKRVENKGSR